MELTLFPILANVISPLHLAGSLVEAAEHAVACAHNQQVAHDCGSGKDSPACIEFPKNRRLGGKKRKGLLGHHQQREEEQPNF